MAEGSEYKDPQQDLAIGPLGYIRQSTGSVPHRSASLTCDQQYGQAAHKNEKKSLGKKAKPGERLYGGLTDSLLR
jgi:hypothetical protein